MQSHRGAPFAAMGCLLATVVLMLARPCSGARVLLGDKALTKELAKDPTTHVTSGMQLVSQGEELLRQAHELIELAPKWQAVMSSLDESQSAIKESAVAVEELGGTISDITSTIEEFGLHSLFDGHISWDDFKLLGHVDKCLGIMGDLLSCAETLETFADLSTKIAKLDSDVQELTANVEQLVGAWSDLDIATAIPELMEEVSLAAEEFKKEASELNDIKGKLGPLIEGWDEKNWMEKGWHLTNYGDDIMSGFTALSDLWVRAQDLYNQKAKPIQDKLQRIGSSMVDAANRFELPVLASSEGHVATEKISRHLCANNQKMRRFKKGSLVDEGTEGTMSCTNLWYVGKFCACAGSEDCYVEKNNRPDPVDKKRCFLPE